MTTVSGILRHYAGGFLRHSRTPVCWQVRSVLAKLGLCRTAALGEHQYRCDQCGHECRVYNSCGDRHCPQCAGAKRSDWLASTAELLLPQVPYFQVVFTIPDKLSSLALGNRKVMFNLLFHAAWSSLKRTVADEQQFQPAAVMIPPSEVRFVEKSTIRSGVAGPDPVRKRAQRAPRTDTADSVFEKSGSDRVAYGSSVLSALRILGGMTGQYQRSDRNTASGYAVRRVRHGRQPERSTAPRACRQESGFPSGLSRREHNWQATHGTRPPLPPILFSRSPPASERKEWGEVRYGGLVAAQLSLRPGQARRKRHSCVMRPASARDIDQTEEVTLPGEEFVRRWSLHILPQGYTRTRRFGGYSHHHVRRYLAECRNLLKATTLAESRSSQKSLRLDGPASEPIRSRHMCPHCQTPLKLISYSDRPSWWVLLAPLIVQRVKSDDG